jgi:hypothetical protein
VFFLKKIFENKYAKIILIAIFFVLIIISRRVDAVTYPQFYAEDGAIWYPDAYNAKNFWDPFLIPVCGYFQTISRIGAAISMSVDIGHAPLLFNSIAIFLEALPAIFFLSSRFEKLIPKFYIRFLCSLAYLLILGTGETHANLTNAQWRLALSMFLIIIAPQSRKIYWKIFDIFFLLLAGLSGPFVLSAFPLAIIYYFFQKNLKVFYARLAVLGAGFFIQLYSYLFIVVSGAMRVEKELGASAVNFFKILSGNIFLRAVLCRDYTRKIMDLVLWKQGFLPVLVGIIGVAILAYIFWKARIELKIFILYTFLIFFAALAHPDATQSMPQWEYMTGGSAGRYYFLPKVAWIISLGWLFFNSRIRFLKIFAGLFFFSFVFLGLTKNWTFDKFHNHHFKKQAAEFKNMKKGETYEFRIVPGWRMTLIKK